MSPIRPERRDDPIARGLQGEIQHGHGLQYERGRRNEKEDARQPRQVRHRDDGIVVAPDLATARREKRTRIACRIDLFKSALREDRECRDLRPSDLAGERHAQI